MTHKLPPNAFLDIRSYQRSGDTDTTATQRTLDAANTLGGATVLVPRAMAITSPLNVYSNTVLQGLGWRTGFVRTSAVGGDPLRNKAIIRLTPDGTGATQGIGIQNLKLDGDNATSNVVGIYGADWVAGGVTEFLRNNWIFGCLIEACTVGLRLVNDQGIAIYSTRFDSNTTGLYASDNSELGYCTLCDYRGNFVGTLLESAMPVTGALNDGIYGWNFTRCHWEGNNDDGTTTKGQAVILDGAFHNTFDTCKFEGNYGIDILMDTIAAGMAPDGNQITNCIFNKARAEWQIDIVEGSYNEIRGGVLNTGTGLGIRIAAAAAYTRVSPRIAGGSYAAKILNNDSSALTQYSLPDAQVNTFASRHTVTVTQTGNYTVGYKDEVVLIDAALGPPTVSLPRADFYPGYRFTIKKIDSSANAVTINVTAGANIDGAASRVLAAQWNHVTVESNGVQYYVIASG